MKNLLYLTSGRSSRIVFTNIFRCTATSSPKSGVESNIVDPKMHFYRILAKEVVSRMNRQDVIRWTRTLGQCASDPQSLKLSLARTTESQKKINKHNVWFWDILWDMTNKSSGDNNLVIPPINNTELKNRLINVLNLAYTSRHSILSDSSDSKKAVVSVARVASHCCDLPENITEKIVELTNQLASESIMEATYLKDCMKLCKHHCTVLYPLFQYLSISTEGLKQKLAVYERSRKLTEDNIFNEIVNFANAIPAMETVIKERAKNKKVAAKQNTWATRAYGPDHCLYVYSRVTPQQCTDLPVGNSIGDTQPTGDTNIQIWPHHANKILSENPFKIFVGNLSNEVTPEILVAAFKGCGQIISSEIISVLKSQKKMEVELINYRSPVTAVHLVKENIDNVASKMMFDLPNNESGDGNVFVGEIPIRKVKRNEDSASAVSSSSVAAGPTDVDDRSSEHYLADPSDCLRQNTGKQGKYEGKSVKEVLKEVRQTITNLYLKDVIIILFNNICSKPDLNPMLLSHLSLSKRTIRLRRAI